MSGPFTRNPNKLDSVAKTILEARKRKNDAENRIAKAYYKTSSGKQIRMLDIPKIYDVGHKAIKTGVDDSALEKVIGDYVNNIKVKEETQLDEDSYTMPKSKRKELWGKKLDFKKFRKKAEREGKIEDKKREARTARKEETQLDEVHPPGREKQVKELKKKFPKSSAYAIAWASYNKSHPKSGKK